MQQRFEVITPSTTAHYLTGDGGVVWFEPDYGENVILAANSAEDRRNVADFIWGCLHLGIAVHGVPPNHHVAVGIFGGDRLKGFRWVHHSEAPQPTGTDGDATPVPARIVMPDNKTFEGLQKITATAVSYHGSTETDDDRDAIVRLIVQHGNCTPATAGAHLERYLRGNTQDRRGGGGRGAGRKRQQVSNHFQNSV